MAHTELSLTNEQVEQALPGEYELLGGRHNHFFLLSAEDFTTLKSGGSVEKIDLEGDGHIVRISCSK